MHKMARIQEAMNAGGFDFSAIAISASDEATRRWLAENVPQNADVLVLSGPASHHHPPMDLRVPSWWSSGPAENVPTAP